MHFGAANVVGIGAEPDFTCRFEVVHMPDRPGATRDIGLTQEFPRRGIETNKSVWRYASLDEPQSIVFIDRHAVWVAVFSGWHLPFGEPPRIRLIATERPKRVINVPDIVV